MANRVVYKYPLDITDRQSVCLPLGAQILSIQAQNNTLMLWAMVDPDQVAQSVVLQILGTGNPAQVSHRAKHIETVQMPTGLVWHIFKEVS